MVYGTDDAKLSEAFQKFVGSDPIYGATSAYLAAQQHYLEDLLQIPGTKVQPSADAQPKAENR